MKKLILVLAAAFSMTALADVKVGDSATLGGTIAELGGQRVSLTNTVVAVSIEAQSAQVRSTLLGEDGTVLSDETTGQPLADLDLQFADYVVANCSAVGGTSVKVSVPAGAFDSCKLTDETGLNDIYVASIPFGIAKIETRDSSGKTVSALELESYVLGN